jgi:NitT/TauT family transport system substrate-binding protein
MNGQLLRRGALVACALLWALSATAADKIVVGALPLNSSAPLFIAAEEGFFAKENLDVDLKLSNSASAIAVGVAAGDYQVGATGVTAALYNIVLGGGELKIVADKGRLTKGHHFQSIVVNKDVHAAGGTSLKALKGKSFGMTTYGSTFHYILGNLAQREGLSLADFDLKALRGVGNMISAISSGQVAFGIFPEPLGSTIVDKGAGAIIGWVDDMMPYQIAVVFYGPELVKNRELGVRFMKAYVRGTRAYYDALLAPGSENSPMRKQALEHIAKWTKRPSDGRGMIYMDRNGELLNDFAQQAAWYADNGFVATAIKAEVQELVDTSFQADAVKRLGN